MERKFKITVDGRKYDVSVVEITEHDNRLLPEPGSMHVAPALAPVAPIANVVPSAEPGDEVSPLAGIVHSVDVAVGQAVTEGDKLASIEAMKMTTAVIAHRNGKIARIDVAPGDAVEAGQTLLNIA